MKKRWSYPSAAARLRSLILQLAGINRYAKRSLLAVSDLAVLGLALWLAMSMRLGELYVAPSSELLVLMCAAPLLGVAIFFWMGVYQLVTRHVGERGQWLIALAVAISSLLWAALVLLSGVQSPYAEPAAGGDSVVRVVPRSVIILYPFFALLLVAGLRQAVAWVFATAGLEPVRAQASVKNVLIYGAGRLGVQLAEALRRSGAATPVGFVDPDPNVWGQYLVGLKVFRPERTESLIERRRVSEVLLAIPQPARKEREAALRLLKPLKVGIRMLPALEDLAEGRSVVSALRPIKVEDLIWRQPLPIDDTLLAGAIAGKSVMVAGAGGAIGSELVRQALRRGPRRLVLFDSNEARLYDIEHEVEGLRAAGEAAGRHLGGAIEVAVVLGSVQDHGQVEAAIRGNGVDTLYHAAAFKSVALVEKNPAAGVKNNTFGTAVLARAAEAAGVERFAMLSSFAAACPQTIVGASMRLAEMVIEARAARVGTGTVFSVVRFASLLDGPGSVLERLQQQIEAGGPVRIGHAQAAGHYLPRSEAAALIMAAGGMAKGGEVFAVDTAEPVGVEDLARSMLGLMGLVARDGEHPDGDIGIEYVAHGEGICEEPATRASSRPTEHAGIAVTLAPACAPARVEQALEGLRARLEAGDEQGLRALLAHAVREEAAFED